MWHPIANSSVLCRKAYRSTKKRSCLKSKSVHTTLTRDSNCAVFASVGLSLSAWCLSQVISQMRFYPTTSLSRRRSKLKGMSVTPTSSIPDELIRQMVMNNSMSTAMGFIPLVGDLAIATFKTNSRNAKLLEDCTYYVLTAVLTKRAGSHVAGANTDTATSSGYAAAPSQGARPTATASAQAPPEYAESSNRAVPPPPPPRP